MLPGGPKNPRQLELMMRRLGMSTEAVPGVEEVIIRTRQQEQVFRAPEVTILTVQGVRTYQVVGTPELRARATTAEPAGAVVPAAPSGPPEEDIRLVMEQASVTREEAIEALTATRGQPAEAILRIMTQGER